MAAIRTIAAAAAALALAACTQRETQTQCGIDSFERGYAAMQAEDWATAERFFDEAAALIPADPYTQLDLGVVEQHLGHPDKARIAYRKAIAFGKSVQPRDTADPLYANRTVAQLAQDDLDGMDAAARPAPARPETGKPASASQAEGGKQ